MMREAHRLLVMQNTGGDLPEVRPQAIGPTSPTVLAIGRLTGRSIRHGRAGPAARRAHRRADHGLHGQAGPRAGAAVGTKPTFFLHLAGGEDGPGQATAAGAPAPTDRVLAGKKVLIVDARHPPTIFALKSVLEWHNMAIMSAETGRTTSPSLTSRAGRGHRR